MGPAYSLELNVTSSWIATFPPNDASDPTKSLELNDASAVLTKPPVVNKPVICSVPFMIKFPFNDTSFDT